MSKQALFDFLSDEYCRLMIDLSKFRLTEEERENCKARFLALDTDKFYGLCHEHELDGVVGTKLLSMGLPLGETWQAEYDRQTAHLSFLRDKAKEICAVMEENGIPMVILKNGGIMVDMMEHPAECPMEDIDSLVKKSDFYRAHEILVQNGFVFKFRSEYEAEKLDEAYRGGSTEYYIMTPNGEKMWFELAWRAVAGRWIRLDLEPEADGLIDRSHCAKDTKVHVLSPEDNLLQVSIHTAKHSYVRAPGLRLHLDVERIVACETIDWKLFLEKVNDTHVKTSTYFSLYIPHVLFGTPVPEWVLDALRPKKRKAKKIEKLLADASLLHPKQRKFGKLKFLRFQTALYDSKRDMMKVLNPGRETMHELYQYKNPLKTPYYLICRLLDLCGIRKKK